MIFLTWTSHSQLLSDELDLMNVIDLVADVAAWLAIC